MSVSRTAELSDCKPGGVCCTERAMATASRKRVLEYEPSDAIEFGKWPISCL